MTAEILLVDDNAIQATTRKAILARSGRSIAIANNGHQALEMLDRIDPSRRVGLVVTDHLMPGMNGPEFVARLRERFPRLPVLVLSGMAEAEEEYAAMNVIFRVKPFPPEDLLALVRQLLPDRMERTA